MTAPLPLPDALRWAGLVCAGGPADPGVLRVITTEGVPCPGCGETHWMFVLTQRLDPAGARWDYRCVDCYDRGAT